MITLLKKHRRGDTLIYAHGVLVGKAWKYPYKAKFGVCIAGVYWRGEGLKTPNTRGGSFGTDVKFMRDVPEIVEIAIAEILKNRPERQLELNFDEKPEVSETVAVLLANANNMYSGATL